MLLFTQQLLHWRIPWEMTGKVQEKDQESIFRHAFS